MIRPLLCLIATLAAPACGLRVPGVQGTAPSYVAAARNSPVVTAAAAAEAPPPVATAAVAAKAPERRQKTLASRGRFVCVPHATRAVPHAHDDGVSASPFAYSTVLIAAVFAAAAQAATLANVDPLAF